MAAGLALLLRERGLEVGYFKPVGMAGNGGDLSIDGDAVFMRELLDLDDDLSDICPMVLREDALHDVFESSESDSMKRVHEAYKRIGKHRDIVICEGLGEIWQGRFLRASGADIVGQLELEALLIAKFAGARLLDDVLYVKEALRRRLLGVVFNMVPESRLELVREQYIPLMSDNGVATYAVLPASTQLAAVSVSEVVRALSGNYLYGAEFDDALVETYMIGAMNPAHARHYFELTPRKAVVVGGDRTKIILSALETSTVLVVLTGNYPPESVVLQKAAERQIALVSVAGDTVSAADVLHQLFGHQRVRERTKVELVAQTLAAELDVDRLLTDLSS